MLTIPMTRLRAALGAACLATALTMSLSPNATAELMHGTGAQAPIQVVPKPVAVKAGHGTFVLTHRTRIRAASGAALPAARILAAALEPATGFDFRVREGRAHRDDIQLKLGGPIAGDKLKEGYRLTVTSSGVTLEAPTQHGLFNGVQTIRQLLPPWIASTTARPGPWPMPAVGITDYPRYGYRGVMLDIARHFQPPAAVKRLIDVAAAAKMNTLHLHLSDDQGFRIVINGFPRLTSVGAAGSACSTNCTTPDPGGFWTQGEYKDVVAYAARNFMTVVPEVDSPGHNNAIVMSEFDDTANPLLNGHPQDINCTAKNPPQWNYTWDVGISAMCPESDNAWTITTAIIKQLSALSSSPYYHLGGDEVPPSRLSAARYAAFVNRESGIVTANGKRPMGWADGYATITGTTPPPGSLAQAWLPGAPDAVAAIAKGMKVVMSPADHIYIDQNYPAPDQSGLGLGWACNRCDLDVNYNWDPAGLAPGVTDADVIGVEGALWGETVKSFSEVEYLLLPRALAIAELAWSPRADRSGKTSPEFLDFATRLAAQGARFQAAGLNFFTTSQVPWRLDLTAGRPAVDRRHVSGTLAVLGSPGVPAGALTATIDWGDGTTTGGTITGTAATTRSVNGLYSINGSHTYSAGGTRHITVTVTKAGGPSATIHLKF